MATTETKLITKAQYARMAGVTGAAVTRLVNGSLAEAMVGEKIDRTHPTAAIYLRKQANKPTEGIDPLYEDAIKHCASVGRYTVTTVCKGVHVGKVRGKAILDLMMMAGRTPSPGSVAIEVPPVRKSAYDPPPLSLMTDEDAASEELRIAGVPDDDIKGLLDLTLTEIHARFGTTTSLMDYLKSVQTIETINEKRLKNAKAEGVLVARETIRVGVFEPIDAAFRRLLTDGAKTIAVRAIAMHQAGRTLKEIETFVGEKIGSHLKPLKAKTVRALNDA